MQGVGECEVRRRLRDKIGVRSSEAKVFCCELVMAVLSE